MTRPLAQRIYGQLEIVRSNAWAVARETGKSVPSQLMEIVALRLGVGKLLPREYYQYQLYDDRQYSWSEKKRFLGSDLENGLIPFLGEGDWIGLANDKLASYAFFKGLGFPIPETYAVCHAYRRFGDVPTLRSREELAHHLRSGARFPFVAKPIFGMWGKDVWAVRDYDAQRDRLVLVNGTDIEIEAFIDAFDHRLRRGILLQELLRPHADVADLCGERICSVRMVSLIDAAGPRLISTLWKIAAGDNMADNYWGPGNLVAPIESATGRVGRPFTGLGRDIRHYDQHPDTGRRLTGAALPDWQAAVKLCIDATATLPGIPMQAWDVALTLRGPVLLEVNVNGGMRLPQLTRQGGLYTDEMREFLAAHGYPRKRALSRLLGL
jgi:glutathione synthase/RimK-type ligase-like ATP-grasp enzyme